ncbi:recQ helicase-like protein [Metarhizium guizhouense ARSEF 977]|uniref:RecQ helicase-like protein n=1 Tax=Metarhizium guizhouense (strain ARSEF 977) TaxID=1276136 RepID=A0A0B4G938_METGA|nr:recQ helicase-like protein [Metarhizium guizhouense ARSEF 977]
MEPFIHLPEYSLLVCWQCGYACVANEIGTHLRREHSNIPPAKRRHICVVQHMDNIIKNQGQLVKFRFPSPSIQPIPHIRPPRTDGLKCRSCQYIVCDRRTIRAHCRQKHSWRNTKSKGRPRADQLPSNNTLPWVEGVQCQRFFLSRRASQWFEVGRCSSISSLVRASLAIPKDTEIECNNAKGKTPRPSLDSLGLLNAVLAREQMLKEGNNLEVSRGDTESQPWVSTSPWMDRTRWPVMYGNARRGTLLALTQLPNSKPLEIHWGSSIELESWTFPLQDEQKLSCLMNVVDLMLDRCEETVRHTSRPILCWLRSMDQESHNMKPFKIVARDSSSRKYRKYWKRCITFVFRCCLLPENTRANLVCVPKQQRMVQQARAIWDNRAWGHINTSSNRLPRNKTNPNQDRSSNIIQDAPSVKDGESNSCSGSDDMDETEYETEDETADGTEDGSDTTSEDEYKGNDRSTEEHYKDNSSNRGGPWKNNDTMLALHPATTELVELVFQLSISISTERYGNGHPISTLLIYFSGILGFSPDAKRFLLAKEYTPVLSGLIYIQRLLFLEYALPLQKYVYIKYFEHLLSCQGKVLNG